MRWILLFLLITTLANAQQFGGGLQDFGPSHAMQIFTDTDSFTRASGPLTSSDFTIQ